MNIGALKHIVVTFHAVFDAMLISFLYVQIHGQLHQNAHFVLGIIRLATEDTSIQEFPT